MLWGGQGLYAGSFITDTWEFGGTSWQQLAPPAQPTGRVGGALTYDPVRQRAVLFGGYGTADLDDTWEWDGATWTQRLPAVRPPARSSAALGFDPLTQRLVLFGGDSSATQTSLDDTWSWDGGNWQQLSPTTRPIGRRAAKLQHDRDRSRLMMLGGNSRTVIIPLLELWEWTGSDWLSRGSLPLTAGYWDAAYDARRGRTMLVLADGYRFELAAPCAAVGSGNATADPQLDCQGRPAVGGNLQLTATTPQAGPLFALLAIGPPTLPVPVPGPFCEPTVSHLPGQAVALPMAGGTVTVAVPPQPMFAFTALTAQAVQFRGGCISASNGLAIRLQPQ
jgi:hypothetical protein